MTLFAAQNVDARGFGGARPTGGGYSAGASRESGAYARGPEGAAGVSRGASGEVYHGPGGTTVAHGSAETHGAAAGPNGAAAGGREVSGTEVKGPEGNEYTHESSAGRGAATGPDGTDDARYASSSSTYHSASGTTYAHGTAGYGAVHTALPTDAGAGYGVTAARPQAAAYAGYHQTEAVSGSVAAARGAAVRSAYRAPGLYGAGWYAANPGAWAPAGWAAGRVWATTTWPAVGLSLGWGSIQPAVYDYGNNVTYQDNEVYYGTQPAATAEEYYQQASAVAQSAPPAPADDWLPLGVFALVQKEQSDPHFVMNLAVNKSGAIGGNYSDLVSGTTVPIQGAVDRKTQRVAWTVGKNKTTVCETGLYNLTQDEAPA